MEDAIPAAGAAGEMDDAVPAAAGYEMLLLSNPAVGPADSGAALPKPDWVVSQEVLDRFVFEAAGATTAGVEFMGLLYSMNGDNVVNALAIPPQLGTSVDVKCTDIGYMAALTHLGTFVTMAHRCGVCACVLGRACVRVCECVCVCVRARVCV